jgi:hypothetical protein
MTAASDVRATTEAIPDTTQRARRILIGINGTFLVLVGGVQVVSELLSYYAGAGIYAPVFRSSPYTIGWVENHGLALLIGLLFICVGVRDGRQFWSAFAIAVHVLLGTANLLFWSSFVHFDLVTMGIAATVAHGLFVAAHTVLHFASRPRASR